MRLYRAQGHCRASEYFQKIFGADHPPCSTIPGILKTSRGARLSACEKSGQLHAGGDSPLDGGLAGADFVRRAGAGRLRAQRDCALRPIWQGLYRTVCAYLDGITLQNAAGPAGGAPHRRLHDLNSERRRRSPRTAENAGGRRYSANIGGREVAVARVGQEGDDPFSGVFPAARPAARRHARRLRR